MNHRSTLLKYGATALVLVLLTGCVPLPHTTKRSAEVRGRVLDANTRAPVQGAKVYLNQAPHHPTFTDADGRFRFKATRSFHLLYVCAGELGHWPEKHSLMNISSPGYVERLGFWGDGGGDAGDILLEPIQKKDKVP